MAEPETTPSTQIVDQSPLKQSFWSMGEGIKGIIIGSFLTGFFGILTLSISTYKDIQFQKIENTAKEKLMKRDFEYQLLIKVFGTKDKKEAAKQLEFFIDAGFLEDKNGRIKEMANNPEKIPTMLIDVIPSNILKWMGATLGGSVSITRSDSLTSILDSLR